MATSTKKKVTLGNLLDSAHLVLDDIHNTEPKTLEPQQVMLGVHISFRSLLRAVSTNDGTKEEEILRSCKTLISDIARLAVYFERSRQNRK
jgi:hypothetical protein